MLAIPPPASGVNVSTFHAAEIAEIYWVFLLALFAEYYLVASNIRKHTLDEIAAVGAVDKDGTLGIAELLRVDGGIEAEDLLHLRVEEGV